MTDESQTGPCCWRCGARTTDRRVAAETVLRGRPREEGGPYRVFRCTGCGVENGVVEDPWGRRMLYPLGGLRPASLLDRMLSAAERRRLDEARLWWLRHRESVERFRRGAAGPRAGRAAGPVPPRQPAAAATASSPRPHGADRAARPPARSGPRAVLGVPEDATHDEIRRAFRRLAKRFHPDHASQSGLTSEAAAERFRAVRAAYEALVD